MSFTTIILFTIIVIGGYLIFTNQIEGRAKMILIVALVIIFIIIFMSLPMFQSHTSLLSTPKDATLTYDIPAMSGQNSANYTLSTWIYINDWNVNYGTEKNIITSKDLKTSIKLDSYDNNLKIVYNTHSGTGTDSVKTTPNVIIVNNINIQKWVNITACFSDNTVDVYINGKLVTSSVVTGTPYMTPVNPGYTIGSMSTMPGFSGSISNVKYYATFLTPQDAWDIYNAGFSSDMLGSFLSQYNAQFTFKHNGITTAQFYLM